MTERPLFYSTNRVSPLVCFDEALLRGQAPDRGLYLPQAIVPFSRPELLRLGDQPYPRVAYEVLRRFTQGTISDERLLGLCVDAYDFDVPLERVAGSGKGPVERSAEQRRWILRLDRGPTASFKDFAARMMARLMSALLRDRDGELVVLTATSGDTGSAVAHAYAGVPNVRVVVLFPPGEVSDRQRRQMTTVSGNVATVAVRGKFDDCQAMVKQAFADPALAGIRLTSANSINIGRLLPQSVYYLHAYVRLADVAAGEPVIISVPSGNFGNMMGAVLAQRMGVPVERLVVATNANDEFPRFLELGRYQKIVPSRECISNAMNVGHPSNLARLVDFYGGHLDETGALRDVPDMDALRRDLFSVSISDDRTRAAIRRVYEDCGAVLEPHGAVGWAGYEHFINEHPARAGRLAIIVETAHPAKFPDEVRAATGVEPEVPPSLAGLECRPEFFETLPADYSTFREWLRARYA